MNLNIHRETERNVFHVQFRVNPYQGAVKSLVASAY